MKLLNTQILKFAFLAMALTTVAIAQAANLKAAPEKSGVTFQAIGRPSLLKINGEGKGVDGQVKVDGGKASGSFIFDLNKLTTGIEMRDTHMKEKYLQVGQYKEAKLTIDSLALPAGWSADKPAASEQPFEGKLALHGVEKPVKGTFKIDGGAGKIPVHAEFSIKLSDFAIDIPTYAGIKVADEVKIQVNAEVNPEAGAAAPAPEKPSAKAPEKKKGK
jgi:polyisoprenoid-binding protein YceI